MNRTTKEELIFGSILLLSNKMQIWGDALLNDLTLKQWFLLMLISKMNMQNPTIIEIAEFTGTSRQNVKKMLQHLEAKEYVCIAKSKTDGRASSVTLCKKTFDYFTDNEQKATKEVNQLFSEISEDDLDATNRTLNKLLLFLQSSPKEKSK